MTRLPAMRRKDREVREEEEIRSIIERAEICRLGMYDGTAPYIVPLNFGYAWEDSTLRLYFHSAREGRKIDILREHPLCCFEMEAGHTIVRGERVCDFTTLYESVMGEGRVEFVTGEAAREHAMRRLMWHYGEKRDYEVSPAHFARAEFLCLTADWVTAKRKEKKRT